jgi:hypothetical protein
MEPQIFAVAQLSIGSAIGIKNHSFGVAVVYSGARVAVVVDGHGRVERGLKVSRLAAPVWWRCKREGEKFKLAKPHRNIYS